MARLCQLGTTIWVQLPAVALGFPVCVAFGNEVEGLRLELLELADTHVRIPMLGQKTSLNVATAAGIVLYELLRKYRVLSLNAR